MNKKSGGYSRGVMLTAKQIWANKDKDEIQWHLEQLIKFLSKLGHASLPFVPLRHAVVPSKQIKTNVIGDALEGRVGKQGKKGSKQGAGAGSPEKEIEAADEFGAADSAIAEAYTSVDVDHKVMAS